MLVFFLIFGLIFGLMSYVSMDLMKSSFFLIFSLLMSILLVSFGMHIWYSYFVCLLFLSGIFVILVYFSSLSKINFVKSYGVILSILFLFVFVSLVYNFLSSGLGLESFYFIIYLFLMIYILFFLLYFMNFCSYYLNFSGALRKV